MNKTFKEVLLYTLIPLGAFLLMCITGDEGILGAGILLLLLVGAYFILGLIMLIANRAHLGKVLLLSSGIILLVGLSTCGLIMNGINFR